MRVATSTRRKTGGCDASPSRATGLSKIGDRFAIPICGITYLSPNSEKTGDPALHAMPIGMVRLAEAGREAALVFEYAEVEPHRSGERDCGREPGLKRERDADHVDDVPEVHGIARPGVDTGIHQALGRRAREAWAAAAETDAIAAAEPVLQIAPQHEDCEPWLHTQRAVERELPGH